MRYLAARILLILSIISFPYTMTNAGEFDVAVVIGNNLYKDAAIPAVDFANNDAENISQYLNELMNIPKTNIINLQNATSGDFIKTFGNKEDHKGLLWQKVDPLGRSRIFIYFSGHGYPSLTGGRLLPSDASHNAAALVGYPLNDLIKNISKIDVSSSVIILDSCFSGLSQNGSLITAASPIYSKEDKYNLPDNMTLITAAGNNEIASWNVEKKQGLFTYHLLNGLYGGGDLNADGEVNVSEIKKYLDTSMTFDARRLFARSQFAYVSGSENVVLGKVSNLKVPNNTINSTTVMSQIINDQDEVEAPLVVYGTDGQPEVFGYRSPPPPPVNAFVFQGRPKPKKPNRKRFHKKPPPRF